MKESDILFTVGGKCIKIISIWNQDSVVGVVNRLWTGCLRNRGLTPGKGIKFFSFHKNPDLVYSPPSLFFSGYWSLFLQWWSGWSVKLTTHLHLMLRLRISGAICLLLYIHLCFVQTPFYFTFCARVLLTQILLDFVYAMIKFAAGQEWTKSLRQLWSLNTNIGHQNLMLYVFHATIFHM